jgi:hypothetical protein
MRFTVLPVGQGTGTLIQVINDAGVPVSSIIIDLGSLWWKPSQTGKVSAGFAEQELRKMPEPTLDAVFLSHADADHINLIKWLIEKFSLPSANVSPDKKLTIKRVWHGGEKTTYAKKIGGNLLDRLETYSPPGPPPESNLRNFQLDAIATLQPLFKRDDLEIFLLAANTVSAEVDMVDESDTSLGSEDDSYLANVVSLVLCVSYGTPTPQRIVATGDATGLTLAQCNTLFAGTDKFKGPILSATLPHHGSAVTTYELLGITIGGKSAEETAGLSVGDFVQHLSPQSATVSSGEWKGYRLPSARVLEDFAEYVTDSPYADPALENTTDPKEHFYTAYYKQDELKIISSMLDQDTWPPEDGWQTLRTHKAVYSTDYFKGNSKEDSVPAGIRPDISFDEPSAPYEPAPPRVAGWAFEVQQNGKWDVKRVYDIQTITGAERALLEQRHGPLPDERFVLIGSAPVAKPAPAPSPGSARIARPARVAQPRRRQPRALS